MPSCSGAPGAKQPSGLWIGWRQACGDPSRRGPWAFAVKAHLRRELLDLVVVAGGAYPDALLRWPLDLVAQPSRHALLFLWAGIGFCGSLTTFSGWMLEVAISLFGGLALLRVGDVLTGMARR